MPDKKLTDSEITKILKYCSNFGNCEYCSMIPPNGIKKGTLGCFSSLIKFALNVIEAKEKEKEKMRYHLADATVRFTALEKETKSEAIKEFAERLKENSIATFSWNGVVLVEEIDNLLKELVGDNQ